MVTKVSQSWGLVGRAEARTLTLKVIDILKGHLWDLLFLKLQLYSVKCNSQASPQHRTM